MHRFARALRRRLHRSDDGGFTLVEQVIALMIAAIVFLAVAVAGMSGVKASVESRLNQQAVDIVNRSIEQARTLTYGELTMVSSDLATNDSSITGTPQKWAVPGGSTEPVDVHTTGSISPHVTTITANVNHATYTLKRYVTVPASATYDDSGYPSVKRFTAVVTWTLYGQTKTRMDSTLITDTRRGLPLPNYTFRAIGTKSRTVNAGATVDFGFAFHNLGARDAFDITVSSSNSALVSGWTLYQDDGATAAGCATSSTAADGVRGCGENNLLTDSDGDGTLDTGQIEPNGNFYVVAERTAGASDTGTVTFTATSVAQPSATGAQHSLDYTVTISTTTVTGAGCPSSTSATGVSGYSLTAFYLSNYPDGDTNTQVTNPLARQDCTVQTESSMPKFSKEQSSDPYGRLLTAGGSATATGTQRAMWWYQPASNMAVTGNGSLRLWVQCNTSASATINAAVGTMNRSDGSANAWTGYESGSATVASCSTSGWQQVDIPLTALTGSAWTVKKSGNPSYLGLRVWSSSGNPNILLGYDWSAEVAYLVLNVNGGQ